MSVGRDKLLGTVGDIRVVADQSLARRFNDDEPDPLSVPLIRVGADQDTNAPLVRGYGDDVLTALFYPETDANDILEVHDTDQTTRIVIASGLLTLETATGDDFFGLVNDELIVVVD